ncbi:MAG TPA: sigma-70 family RNA polymerase sigma factor [Candidatus Paceibacterota bacterium]|nr:sigma-70 family RNA polymerase sigma factor [Verrucomicrobiota bacterium]HRY50791.1 sigma-70 family RNA polymerase sigma factor [Candidatus Paceibacterota bacterium]HSA00063.1 sigma-70 family RNA polymerase sigma factor [Candidatus Paceibacterota bacterium]
MTSNAAAMRPSDAWFRTTHWSVVLTAGRSDTPGAQAALENLCRIYWRPLYAYARRRGHSPEDAADLTQEFFRRLLERQSLADVHPDKGRFRSFLLAAMNHFLSDAWDKAQAKKRGAACVIAIDVSELETQLAGLAGEARTPEQAYERQWALALLDEVYQRLEREYQEHGKTELFAALRPALAGSREAQPYSELAQGLGLSEGMVRVAVHRLRRRYREVLREVIADSVAHPDEVEDEFRYLLRVLGRG